MKASSNNRDNARCDERWPEDAKEGASGWCQ